MMWSHRGTWQVLKKKKKGKEMLSKLRWYVYFKFSTIFNFCSGVWIQDRCNYLDHHFWELAFHRNLVILFFFPFPLKGRLVLSNYNVKATFLSFTLQFYLFIYFWVKSQVIKFRILLNNSMFLLVRESLFTY